MQQDLQKKVIRNARFLGSVGLAALGLFSFFGVVAAISTRIPGLTGVAVGIFAGGCLVLGVLVAYWTLADWLNLKVIRRKLGVGDSTLHDGEVVAFDGFVRIEAEPLTAPFSGAPCARSTP